ncbi:MAG: hypothetical protein Q4D81_12275 [Eubacteriales bacterium]|nr:hypothetical protein [Eubacteriales bacterium]
MKLQNILQDTEKAYERHELLPLLKGQGGYSLPVPDFPVDIPTDWTRIIPLGIHRLFAERKEPGIIKDYEKAIRELCGGSGTDVWICAYVLYVQLDTEARGMGAFSIDRGLIPVFTEAVARNAPFLKENRYGTDTLSMYEDIQRLDTILREDYDLNILPAN